MPVKLYVVPLLVLASCGGTSPLQITYRSVIPPGMERYVCQRITLSEDRIFTSFWSSLPAGFHHVVVTVGPPAGVDGTSPCQASAIDPNVLFTATQGGSFEVRFPPEVGLQLRAGQQLLLNWHLFNAGQQPLESQATLEMRSDGSGSLRALAEVTLVNKLEPFEVPPGSSNQSVQCTMQEDTQVFLLGPHMHRLGRSSKTTVLTPSGESTVMETPFDFQEQRLSRQDPPLFLHKGDRLNFFCNYINNTDTVVHSGVSISEEMCLVAVYRYPAVGTFFCEDPATNRLVGGLSYNN